MVRSTHGFVHFPLVSLSALLLFALFLPLESSRLSWLTSQSASSSLHAEEVSAADDPMKASWNQLKKSFKALKGDILPELKPLKREKEKFNKNFKSVQKKMEKFKDAFATFDSIHLPLFKPVAVKQVNDSSKSTSNTVRVFKREKPRLRYLSILKSGKKNGRSSHERLKEILHNFQKGR